MKKTNDSQTKSILIIVLLFMVPYALGVFFPDHLWAFHFPAFLPNPTGVLLILTCIILAVYSINKGLFNSWNVETKKQKNRFYQIGLTLLAGIVLYKLSMYSDIYGDAYFLAPEPDIKLEMMEHRYLDKLFSFNFFDPKIGSATIFGLIGTMSYYFDLTVGESFRLLDAICGALFVFFMVSIIFQTSNNRLNRFLMVLMILGTPLVQVFSGHNELYAPVYLLITVFWWSILRYKQKNDILNLLVVVAIIILNIKFHITGWLLIPVVILALFIFNREADSSKSVKWSTILKFVILPLYLMGILLYVFITKSTFGRRFYTSETIFDVLFLPISSSDTAPLDRYNLFSPAHIFDYVSTWFMWSASGVLILALLLMFLRKKVNWNNTMVRLSGFLMLIYLPLFFVLNPLFSMPADWDLMGIPGITFLIFIFFAWGTTEKPASSFPWARLAGVILGLSVIASTFLIVNQNSEMQAKRYISMGKYQFKTYWIGTSSYIMHGVNQLESDKDKFAMLEKVIVDLEPHALKKLDPEYAKLVAELAAYYRTTELDSQYTLTLETLEKSSEYGPHLLHTKYQLLITYFMANDYENAMRFVPELVKEQYPNQNKSLRVAIHTAIMAEEYQIAEDYCEMFLQIWSDDRFINKVLQQLKTAEDKESVKDLFRNS